MLCCDESFAVALDHPPELGMSCDVGIGEEISEQFSEVDLFILAALHEQGIVLLLHLIIIHGQSKALLLLNNAFLESLEMIHLFFHA